jgi:hypothetical protein
MLAPLGPVLVLVADGGLIAVESVSPSSEELLLYGFLKLGLPQLRSELALSANGVLGWDFD